MHACGAIYAITALNSIKQQFTLTNNEWYHNSSKIAIRNFARQPASILCVAA